MTEEDVKRQIIEGEEEYAKKPDDFHSLRKIIWGGYQTSMYILEENTLENAKRLGYLDARELYPDIPVQSLEDFAEEFYSLPEPGAVIVRE